MAVRGPLSWILSELDESRRNDYKLLKILIQQRLRVTAEMARVRFQQLKKGEEQTFTQFAGELS